MKAGRLLSVCIALVLLAAVSVAAAATPLASPCMPGSAYDPACDVDHNGAIDVTDIQLTAGHWGQTGTYNIYPAMVPKTGQTSSFAVGDDGALQKGVAWPNPRFTDNSNGSVTDNLTGLIWLKNANCFGQSSWDLAVSDANTLNSGECGLTDGSAEGDWRLPNVREMQSLVDYKHFDPAMQSGQPFPIVLPFTGVQSSIYWTSTTLSPGPSSAWVVELRYGRVDFLNKYDTHYLWPVRD